MTAVMAALIAANSAAQPPVPVAPPAVGYIDHVKVAEALRKDATLYETPAFKVRASRRDKAGAVEIHQHETDIFYVLKGSATFVTGGHIIGAGPPDAGEIRGTSIDGGAVRTLTVGDVIVVPAGTPHWFKKVKGPFLYFVVKPIS